MSQDPDNSGQLRALDALANLEEFAPIAPLLKKSVEHMRKNNGHQLLIHTELSTLNAAQARQQRMTGITNILVLVIAIGSGFSLFEVYRLRDELVKTNAELARVIDKLVAIGSDTESTKKALEERPKITVKADSTSSSPVLVVEQPKSHPSASKNPKSWNQGGDSGTFEFPIGPPKKKSKDKP